MKHLLLLFLFFASFCCKAQKYSFKNSLKLNTNDTITYLNVDDSNNLYYISGFNVLNKHLLNKQGQNFEDHITYSNRSNLQSLNVQNPLQLTVKSNFFDILVLDNRLQEIQDPIQFPVENNFTPTLTDLLDTNYIWGYDPILEQLILWDYQQEKIFRESVLLSGLQVETDFKDLKYSNRKVYLFNDSKILMFDEFANFEKKIPFEPYEKIYIVNKKVFYNNKGQLYCLNLESLKTEKLELKHSVQDFAINDEYLFVLNKNLIYIYQPQKKK